MKIIRSLPVRAPLLALAGLAALLALTPAHAGTLYWSGSGSSQGGSGTWDTTNPRWSTTGGTGGPWNIVWSNAANAGDTALFAGSTTFTCTLGANITLGGLTQQVGGGIGSDVIAAGSGPYTLTLGVSGNNTFSMFANTTVGRYLYLYPVIAGGSGNNLVVAGPSSSGNGGLYLFGANTFSGGTSFTAGATGGAGLTLGNQLALQNSTVSLSPAGNLSFDSSVSANAFTLGGLSASSAGTGYDLALQNNAASPIALTVGGNNSSTTYSGVLSGGGSLIKTGSGTLVLSAASTYTGSTVISGGTLQVDGIIASPTTVNGGGTLAGGGLVNAAVTVTNGGTVTAGDGTGGSLAVSGLAFNGTGTINVGTLSGYTSAAAIVVSNALTTTGWNYSDNATHEWTGHYTIVHLRQGYCCFQLRNSDNDWAFQLEMGTDGSLSINNRRSADATVTNPDGSAKNFTGKGFDVRVLDDGTYYKVWIDGVLYANSSYSRPTGSTVFRWGMYFGSDNLHPPSDYNLIMISGAQVQSWPGTLASSVSQVVKANNTTNLDNGASWNGGVAPGLYNQAVWNNTVTSANATTLASNQEWSGIQILNPGGPVTINGTGTLVLDALGVDLSAATQDLTVNCPVQMTVSSTCGVASGRAATFNGAISGFSGLTVNGGGIVQLSGANTYSGNTVISAGRLVTSTANALSSNTSVLQSGGGQLFLNTSGTFNQNMNLSTTGYSEGDALNNVDGAIRAEYTSTLGGTITLSGNSRIGNANSGNIETISGQITGNYGLDFYGMNNLGNNQIHVFVLSNPANNYSGNTTIYCNDFNSAKTGNSTTLRMGGPVVIPSGSSAGNVVFNGADANHLTILDLNGNSQNINGTTAAAAAGAQITNSAATIPATLNIGAGDTTSAFSGVIADKGSGNLISLTKQGAGTLTLSGANTYGGGTAINGGTLLAGNTGASATGTGAVNINAGGTLGGYGIISGPVTNNAGGTLSPGAGVGTLTLSGKLVLNPGSTNLFEVNGTTPTNDVVALGGVTYGGVLKIVPTGTFTVGQTFRLFTGAGATGPGNFSSLQGSPGSGKLFTFTNSVLTVVAAGPSGPARLTNSYSGGVLSLSWPAGQGWRLQMQTNSLSVGLRRNWIYITDGTIASTNIAVSPTQPAAFFRLTYP